MRKNNEKETAESGRMLALTMALTNVLLLTVVVGAFRLALVVVAESRALGDLLHGFNLL